MISWRRSEDPPGRNVTERTFGRDRDRRSGATRILRAVRGTNSAQLAFINGQWKILSLYWETETEMEHIPQTLR